MKDRHLCCPPYFFLGPTVPPHFLKSRIATEGSITNSAEISENSKWTNFFIRNASDLCLRPVFQ